MDQNFPGRVSPELPKITLWIMAFSVGASVANLYYNQPLLHQLQDQFQVSMHSIGLIPTLTQAGYALGMLFLVPLGDMLERKRLVMIFTLLAATSLAIVTFAQSFAAAAIGSLLLGLSTMTPQLLIPFAAALAKPDERGKTVGFMISGILLGVLLARTVSGFVGAAFGWRAMFGGASAFQLVMFWVLAFSLPKSVPSYGGKYLGLLKSVIQIFGSQPVLRESCLFGAVLFGSFSMFWATLIYLMESPAFDLGARAVGLFGLLGAVAAGFAPMVGSWVDRREARQITGIMIGLTFASFLIFGLSAHSLLGIGVGVIVMDVGVQGGHVTNQSRILNLIPGAQSRLQTAYMFFYFVGGAIGSWVGTWSFDRFGWVGVCGSATLSLAAGFLFFVSNRKFMVQAKSI